MMVGIVVEEVLFKHADVEDVVNFARLQQFLYFQLESFGGDLLELSEIIRQKPHQRTKRDQ